jgi:hypothetical protein
MFRLVFGFVGVSIGFEAFGVSIGLEGVGVSVGVWFRWCFDWCLVSLVFRLVFGFVGVSIGVSVLGLSALRNLLNSLVFRYRSIMYCRYDSSRILFIRGSSELESLILSHHSRFNVTCECNKEKIHDDDDDDVIPRQARGPGS